jgi:hypothetical protein
MGRGAASPTSTFRLAAAEKQLKVLELRRAGRTFAAIAEQLGYSSESGARRAFTAALARVIKQPAEHMRQLLLMRYEACLKAIYPKAIAGDLRAIDRLLRINQQIAALCGLNTVKVKVSDDADAPPPPVAVDAKARGELFTQLSSDQQRFLRDIRNRLAESAGAGGGDEGL